jgi:hypothetical protein
MYERAAAATAAGQLPVPCCAPPEHAPLLISSYPPPQNPRQRAHLLASTLPKRSLALVYVSDSSATTGSRWMQGGAQGAKNSTCGGARRQEES